jgi:hypothetical protein
VQKHPRPNQRISGVLQRPKTTSCMIRPGSVNSLLAAAAWSSGGVKSEKAPSREPSDLQEDQDIPTEL